MIGEIEYQMEEMLFKMNALAGTSNLPEKPPMYFTDSDATYPYGEDGASSGSSELNVRPWNASVWQRATQKLQ